MNSFKNPIIPLIADPVNIDRPIQEMQISLAAGLPWLARCFGRSWDSVRKDSAGKIWTYPEVWQGPATDLLNVMPNDNLDSQVFFKVEEPIQVIEYSAGNYSRMNANVSIIFWFNLKLIDPDLDYRFIELLKGQAQRVITETGCSPEGTFTILRIWEGAQNVFKGYTLDIEQNQDLIHPYGGFRFECGLNFSENCPNVALHIGRVFTDEFAREFA